MEQNDSSDTDAEQNNTERKVYSIELMKRIGDQERKKLSASNPTTLAVKKRLANLKLVSIMKQR